MTKFGARYLGNGVITVAHKQHNEVGFKISIISIFYHFDQEISLPPCLRFIWFLDFLGGGLCCFFSIISYLLFHLGPLVAPSY